MSGEPDNTWRRYFLQRLGKPTVANPEGRYAYYPLYALLTCLAGIFVSWFMR